MWHKKHREQGLIFHRSIATEAGWRKSGWYGWKLHLAGTVGSIWVPLAAELTGAHRGAHEMAPLWVAQLPGEVRDVWGDIPYHAPEWRQQRHGRGCDLVATRRGPEPQRDGGVEVRRVFHKRRSQAIEPCNGVYKNVFEWRVKVPVKGLQRLQLLALGAVVVYKFVLLYQHTQYLPLGKGIKPLLRAA
jgi:hypothetical protein